MTDDTGYWRCAKCDLLHVFPEGPSGRHCDHCGWGAFNAGKATTSRDPERGAIDLRSGLTTPFDWGSFPRLRVLVAELVRTLAECDAQTVNAGDLKEAVRVGRAALDAYPGDQAFESASRHGRAASLAGKLSNEDKAEAWGWLLDETTGMSYESRKALNALVAWTALQTAEPGRTFLPPNAIELLEAAKNAD